MDSTAFTPLELVHLSSPSRLLSSSCCPDKDLFVILSRLGGVDRISLWNSTSGAKIWEIDLGDEDNGSYVAGLAWSPDNQTIAFVHEPPTLTFHSIQDGHRQKALPLNVASTRKDTCTMTGIWWFRDEKVVRAAPIPDIFRRGEMITGTALPTLKYLPLLDGLQDDSEKITATDLFAFQGSNVRSVQRSHPPDVIGEWPTLMVNSIISSISSPSQKSSNITGGSQDEVDTSNSNSVLLVTDDLGHIYCFLDGCFPLGVVKLGSQSTFTSAIKHPGQPEFLGHLRATMDERDSTAFWPTAVKMPLLGDRKTRDLAMLSSVARELVWYTMRVVKEMRAVWFGSETTSGARELGPKWIRALEAKQKEQFGQEEPTAILDLTCLLLTGRASESLLDFLGSGEQMSERGIQKWESTVAEALTKLRDYSEKRVAPACQRLHLVLEELRGWALLPRQYAVFELTCKELDICLEFASRAIIIASWLASVARRELSRFREFILWLRFETSAANPANDTNPAPRHDILEVNHYFMSGLVVSSIDKWFMGPVPQFHPRDLGIPGEDEPKLASVMERARAMLNNPAKPVSQTNITPKDLSHLDRNLDALVQELAIRCQQVFIRAAGAACRSATASSMHGSSGQMRVMGYSSQSETHLLIRERTIINERGQVTQSLAHIPTEKTDLLGVAKLSYTTDASGSLFAVSIALLECYLPEEEEEESVLDLELLEAEFLDDECVVIIYRIRGSDHITYTRTFIAVVDYSSDVEYQEISTDVHEKLQVREDLMQEALKHWREGKLCPVRLPIKRRRALRGCRDGAVHLAVNGRAGRRVACVLDNSGTTVEIFDLEEDGEDVAMDEDSQ